MIALVALGAACVALAIFAALRAQHAGLAARTLPANPVSATFDASDTQIRACLAKVPLILDAARGTHLAFMQSTAADGFPEAVFRDPANARDVVLKTISFDALSEAYSAKGEPLPYRVDLHVHVVPVSDHRTTIDVRALRYEVAVGKSFTPLGHGWWKTVYEPVSPTTIDEYRILKVIASCLGSDSLPAVRVP